MVSAFSFLKKAKQGAIYPFHMVFAFAVFQLVFICEPVSAQSYDDWFYNPYNKNSAYHRPIGTGAIYADDEHPATTTWLQHNGMKFNYEHPYGAPYVAVDETDTVVTVPFSPGQITNPGPTLPVDVRIPRFRWPVNPEPPGINPDGAVAIYDRTTGMIHNFYNYRYNDGSPVATIHRAHDIKGLGHGTRLGQLVGVTAAGMSINFGALQPWELEKPGHKIGHALQILIPRHTRANQPQLISKKIQWPATMGDGASWRPDQNLGHIPYGGLMAIPTVDKGGPDLNELGLSPPGLRLAEALRDYGAYVIDGGQMPVIRTTENFPQSLYNQLHFTLSDDLKKIYREMRLVLNSVEGATAEMTSSWPTTGSIGTPTWPAGGGEPLAPNTAIDAVTSSEKIIYPDYDLFNGLQVFPNPAKDNITVRLDNIPGNGVEIDVTNMLGQVVVTSQRMTEPVINISLPEGQTIYFVRITSNYQSKTIRVIKL